jgi:hypothetical protein
VVDVLAGVAAIASDVMPATLARSS